LRQPGTVACSLATMVPIIQTPWILTVPVSKATGWTLAHYLSWLSQCFGSIGYAVFGGWLALIMAGRWQRSHDWVDRLGRVLGASWILAPVVIWILWLLK
jgi:hypothetical protein